MPKSINPATEETTSIYEPMTMEKIGEILQKAGEAAELWGRKAVTERAKLAGRAAEVLEERKEALARTITIEMGKPIIEARSEIEKCAWVCRYYAEEGPEFLSDEELRADVQKSFTCFQPLGLVLAVMPWNFPFWQVFRFAAPGLTAGNGAILKHSSNVTGCGLAIESVFREAGYPADLFRTLIADSGQIEAVVAHPSIKAATLTGSEAAGRSVAGAAGKVLKKTVLELGGSDPYLILEDADLELAAKKCAQSRLLNTGQSCIAAKRFIVLRKVKQEFTRLFVEEMSSQRMGDPLDEETDLGPLARKDLREELEEQVEKSIKQGAEKILGGEVPARGGYYYPPTVLDNVKPGMPAADEELFGPVAAIMEVEDVEEAIQLANSSRFGLGSAVFTRDLSKGERVARQLESGCSFVNNFVKSDPRLPFGGIKASGYGRELARQGIKEFVNIKTVVIDG